MRTRNLVGLTLGALALCIFTGCVPEDFIQLGQRGKIVVTTNSKQPLRTTPFGVGLRTVVRFHEKDAARPLSEYVVEPSDPTLFTIAAHAQGAQVTALRPGSGELIWKRNGVEIDRFAVLAEDVAVLELSTGPRAVRALVGARVPMPYATARRADNTAYFGDSWLSEIETAFEGGLAPDADGTIVVSDHGTVVFSAGVTRAEITIEAVPLAALTEIVIELPPPYLSPGSSVIWYSFSVDLRDAHSHVVGTPCAWNDASVSGFTSDLDHDWYSLELAPGETRTLTCTIGALTKSVTITTPARR